MHCQDLNLRTVCLQRHPEYFEQTITLLNNQWPRSRTARLRSLEQGSKDALPTSLVVILKDASGKESVVAHSKISPVPYQPLLCFVESVVVAPELRGKGLGRFIMDRTESYVKALGITTVYLTTFDQQGFYSRLGYSLCDPIVVFGGSMKLAGVMKADNFLSSNSLSSSLSPAPGNLSIEENTSPVKQEEKPLEVSPPLPPAPPPPPPPPPSKDGCQMSNNNALAASKVTMKKYL